MSLDVDLIAEDGSVVFSYNITHNLGAMARFVGCYEALWRPEEIGIEYANQLTPLLSNAAVFLALNKDKCEEYNPKNGWGDYNGLLRFVQEYMIACANHPFAQIKVSR